MSDESKLLQELYEIAQERSGSCLSQTFLGMKKKLIWECAEGHTWKATPHNIKILGKWCPVCERVEVCRNRQQHSLEDMQQLAKSRRGLCLSNHYESVITKLTWQCENKHIWEAKPSHIKNGTWCPICSIKLRSEKNKTHTITEMQVIANSRSGKCLSKEYFNNSTHLLWECKAGHQ